MAKNRQKPDNPTGKKTTKTAHSGHVKRTMWLPIETAKKLRHAAIEQGKDIGQIVAPLIDRELANCYWAVRNAAPKLAVVETETPAPAEGETPEAEAA